MTKKSQPAKGPVRATRPPASPAADMSSLQQQLVETKGALEKCQRALQLAKLEVRSANDAKEHFLAIVAHELRSPLTAILLWSKLLNAEDEADTGRREGLQAIEKAAREQQEIVEVLLDQSRIVSGKLRLQPAEVVLANVVRDALAAVRTHAAQKNIILEESVDAEAGTVRADPHRLKQVFSNLLQNAVKFTPEQGRVTFTLTRSGDLVVAQVVDTGCGIDREVLPHLFEGFTRTDSSSIPKAGLGLGLSMARHFAALHGGEITAHSDGPRKGATFAVRLPLPRINS